MLLQLKASFVGDFDYDKEEFSDPKEIKAEGELVKEAVKMVNRASDNSVAKVSADLIKYDLEENEEKRSEKAPGSLGESEDGKEEPIEKMIDESATNKEQTSETVVKQEQNDNRSINQVAKRSSGELHVEVESTYRPDGAAEEKKKQEKVVKESTKMEKPKHDQTEKEQPTKIKQPDHKDNTSVSAPTDKSSGLSAFQSPSNNDVAKILDEVH